MANPINQGPLSGEAAFTMIGSSYLSNTITDKLSKRVDIIGNNCAEKMRQSETCAPYADDASGCFKKSSKYVIQQSSSLFTAIGISALISYLKTEK